MEGNLEPHLQAELVQGGALQLGQLVLCQAAAARARVQVEAHPLQPHMLALRCLQGWLSATLVETSCDAPYWRLLATHALAQLSAYSASARFGGGEEGAALLSVLGNLAPTK